MRSGMMGVKEVPLPHPPLPAVHTCFGATKHCPYFWLVAVKRERTIDLAEP